MSLPSTNSILPEGRTTTSLRLENNASGAEMHERDWIDGTRAGDYKAFDAMFLAYAERLCAYACGLLRSREDAQEVVQDLFLSIWKNRERWHVPGQLRTYLYHSVRNRAISTIRRRRVEAFFRLKSKNRSKELPSYPTVAWPDAQDRLEAAELSAQVARALDALPERCRQVFVLARQHHMSYAEVAQIMQISPRTVENHMARAFAGLRSALGAWLT